MNRPFWIVLIVLCVCTALTAPAFAQWQTSMEIGGFSVTEIKGEIGADGSGRATGKLQLPDSGSCGVDLTRTASGVVTGSTRSNFTVNSIRIEGGFLLDRNGLRGTGTLYTRNKSVSDANISMNSRGEVSGQGKVRFGSDFSIDVDFTVNRSGINISGTASRQVSIDTSLAVYVFKGDIELSSSGDSLVTVAKGSIDRKGKIGGVVTTFGPLTFNVDATGKANPNVGGTNIAIDLW